MSYRCRRLLALVVTSLLCGDQLPLQDKVFGSTRVVEFTIGMEAKEPRIVGKVLFPPESGERAPPLERWRPPCKQRRPLRLLAFFDAEGRQLVGLERTSGRETDLDPVYAAMVEAVLEAKSWSDERMHAVGAEQLWQQPKKALASANPIARRLAAGFLMAHGAADVVEAAWGAAGSAARKKNEAGAMIQTTSLCGVRK